MRTGGLPMPGIVLYPTAYRCNGPEAIQCHSTRPHQGRIHGSQSLRLRNAHVAVLATETTFDTRAEHWRDMMRTWRDQIGARWAAFLYSRAWPGPNWNAGGQQSQGGDT